MATGTMTFERLTSMLRPQPTFWSGLSSQERQLSVNQAVHRPLGDKTAWDAAGLVSQYWIDEICPLVEEYRRTHSKYILNGKDWTGPVNCFMVGVTWMTAMPTVVITSLDKGIYGRFGSLLRKDDRFRRSGFSILGQRGCLRLKMKRSDDSLEPRDPTADGSQRLYGETIVIPHSWSAEVYEEAVRREYLLGMRDRVTIATMGGVIEIGGQQFGLTVAHPFVDPKRNVPAENASVASLEPSIILQREAPEHISLDTIEVEEVFESDILDDYDNDGDPTSLADRSDLLAVHIDEDLPARPIFLGAALDLFRESIHKRVIFPLHSYADMQIGTFPGSSIATKGRKFIEGEPRKHADLGLDWALIDLSEEKQIDGSNTLVTDGVAIRTSNVAKGPPFGEVLVVCKASRYPQATCSGTVALISIPGSGRLQKAYTLKGSQFTAERGYKSSSGERGSFVIDKSTGDAYGVVVAESLDLELTYMIPLDLIFENIASKWAGNVVRFPQIQQKEGFSNQGPRFSLKGRQSPGLSIGRSGKDQRFSGSKLLPSHDDDDNVKRGEYGNELEAASSQGHEETVESLLSHGADVNAQGGEYGTALQAASFHGHKKIVESLLNHGADVNAQTGLFGSALQAASFHGHEKIIESLLNYGADVNAQGGEYGNALQVASFYDYKKIVESLLNRGADVNAQGGRFGNALQAASLRGHKEIVESLLSYGADVNAQGGRFGNALQAASLRGHKEIVESLLNHGANINAQGGLFGNALQAASFHGHEKIIEFLLNYGADVNAQGGEYGNALQAASLRGHKEIVESLLNRGADVNAQGGRFGNAL